MQGTSLGSSEPDGPGRVLRPIVQIRTLGPEVTQSGWQTPRKSPAWTLLTLPPCIALATKSKVGTERVQEGRRAQAPAPQACVSSVCLMSSQPLANICSVSHPDTFCRPTCSASLYSFLSFSVSDSFSLLPCSFSESLRIGHLCPIHWAMPNSPVPRTPGEV